LVPLLPEFQDRPEWHEGELRRCRRDWYDSLKAPWFTVVALLCGTAAGILTYGFTEPV